MFREIFKFIFDRITDPLSLPINPLYEWIILGIIGLAAYCFAYRIVGDLYDSGDINGSVIGSIIHWVIRLFVFFAIWFITNTVIVVGQWIVSHWVIVAAIAGALVLTITIAYATYKFNHAVKS